MQQRSMKEKKKKIEKKNKGTKKRAHCEKEARRAGWAGPRKSLVALHSRISLCRAVTITQRLGREFARASRSGRGRHGLRARILDLWVRTSRERNSRLSLLERLVKYSRLSHT